MFTILQRLHPFQTDSARTDILVSRIRPSHRLQLASGSHDRPTRRSRSNYHRRHSLLVCTHMMTCFVYSNLLSESLARTAVARESVSSMVSAGSARTRVVSPPTIPAPTAPLPTPPLPNRSFSSAAEEKRLLALQNALHAQLPPSPASPLMSAGSEASPLLTDGHRRSASGRPLPDAPSGPNSASSMSARDEKAFLSQPWTASSYPSVPRRPDSPGARSVAESSRHGRRDTMPPAYSRPPSRSE